jgi:hypothetical protein
MSRNLRQVFLCCHCGNTTPHELKLDHAADLLCVFGVRSPVDMSTLAFTCYPRAI